jgi:hypothetical protein
LRPTIAADADKAFEAEKTNGLLRTVNRVYKRKADCQRDWFVFVGGASGGNRRLGARRKSNTEGNGEKADDRHLKLPRRPGARLGGGGGAPQLPTAEASIILLAIEELFGARVPNV